MLEYRYGIACVIACGYKSVTSCNSGINSGVIRRLQFERNRRDPYCRCIRVYRALTGNIEIVNDRVYLIVKICHGFVCVIA